MTLVVSGMLWEMSLVMMDLETKSLWSHLLGESMKGKLVGEKLKVIPSVMTDWKSWQAGHPDTTCVVMPRTAANFKRSFLNEGFHHSPLVIGITAGKESRYWRFASLQTETVHNDIFGEQGIPVVAVYDGQSGTAVVYGRNVDGRVLTFHWEDDSLVDKETESTWNLLTGIASSGESAGKSLGPQRGIVSFEHAWNSFHPESTRWQPEDKSTQQEK